MEIRFGGQTFTVTEDGRLYLSKCFFIDNTGRDSRLLALPAYDVAGGSTGGTPNLVSAVLTDTLRYARHEISGDVLTVVQTGEGVEITSRYVKHPDTNAIPFTRGNIDWDGFRGALREIGYKAPLMLETDVRKDIPEGARPHALRLMYETAIAPDYERE